MPTFLADREPRAVELQVDGPTWPCDLHLGGGPQGLQVLVGRRPVQPREVALRAAFDARRGSRAAPVMIVALWGDDRASLHGGSPFNPLHLGDAPASRVEQVCRMALDAPDRHAALRLLQGLVPHIQARVPGLRNSGLFATHELEHGVPRRTDWVAATGKATPALSLRGRRLIEALGFEIEEEKGPTSILLAKEKKTAVAVFLTRPDEIELGAPLFDQNSPVSFALARATRENLDYVVVSAGDVLRVYPTAPQRGVGRRAAVETYVELNLALLDPSHGGYLWLLASADALTRDGTFLDILGRSEEYAVELGRRLRERVYKEVIPPLADAVVKAMGRKARSSEGLREAYEGTLRILFRLLFVAYAEDKDLLPFHASASYRRHSLKGMALALLEARRGGRSFGAGTHYWTDVRQLWDAVHDGNPEWGVPAYDGGLFSSDPAVSPAGALLAGIAIPDDRFAPALTALLLDKDDEGIEGPVDFRSLGVREFGTIYEGLLESELSIADVDLAVDPRTEAYVPATGNRPVLVRAGSVYLHNASGARKASGSYYTKAFAVDHLLDRALEPALEDHLARLDGLSDADAADAFFAFRVADIAMGSGHFLVAAVDRIERRLLAYLAKRPLPKVADQLSRLRKVAMGALGPEWSGDPIEDGLLLRRQIARHCIFGVDLNPMAVELARLSVWIHTFVPGLPLSLLDHNLVRGNSLVGIATIEEAQRLVEESQHELFGQRITDRLEDLREPLRRLARLTDATQAEIDQARDLWSDLLTRMTAEAQLLDMVTASRTEEKLSGAFGQGEIDLGAETFPVRLVKLAQGEMKGLHPLHFPLAFPQVFLGDRGGFDVILGNPPWEEATLEEDAFWARHFPGLRSRPQREQEELKRQYRAERPDLAERFEAEKNAADALRRALNAGAYPGMGTGDPDLYKAFVWRFWDLVAPDGGRIGVVLPRSAMAAKGSASFREALLTQAEVVDLTMLLNNKQWVFEEVHPQYTIGLVAITRRPRESDTELLLRGPYANLTAFRAGVVREPARFYGREVQSWNDTSSLPLLPDDASVEVFAQLRKAPRLDLDDGRSWRVRPHRELDATNDKALFDVKSEACPRGFWPVFKGESFDLWTPDTGTYYAFADPEAVLPVLQKTRERRQSNSVFAEFPEAWRKNPKNAPPLRPRIAFRDISRSTDSRTVRVALVPGRVFITNQAPYLLWPRGDESDQAYLLGVLSSLPLDWYARRFVETHVNFFVFNPFPVPRPSVRDALRARVVRLAGRLAAPDRRFAKWAEAVGVEHGLLEADEKDDMIHELDAAVAHLYGLPEAQLVHVFETFHEGWDYEERLRATLKHYRDWARRTP
ncbi:MAG TPA: hypothetical protein VLH75_06155 [Longimicrobiales bacterium]|nr:hypothetical protein [Longimicrobiales bacterium]